VEQVVEGFKNRQVRFSAGQPLRTPPARHHQALTARRRFRQEVLDEACLADARLAGDRK
jgi:hypothetical protein